jgi:hypothetical protein
MAGASFHPAHTSFWPLLATALAFALAPAAPALRADDSASDLARLRARGWAPPTPEDAALYRQLGHRLEALHLNALALRRLHAAELADQLDRHAMLVRRPGRGQISRPVSATEDEHHHHLEPGLGVRRLPRSVDNSALPYFPPIFDQGRLESCTAVVSTYYQLTHTVGLMRGWDQSLLGNEHRFSPAWTYNLTNNGNNAGVSLLRSYAALSAHGAVTLQQFPYRGSPSPASNYRRWSDDPALWREALTHRIERFGIVDSRDPVRFLREIKRLLLNGHVLTGSTAIDGWNRRAIAAPPGVPGPHRHVGEFICTRIAPDSEVNHAITIVGYDDGIWVDLDGDGRVGPGEKGALKIANSWGRGDWNRGYRWLHYSAVTRYGPSRHEPAGWRGAFWLDRVYWLVPYRYYQPARVLELDISPALRGDIRLAAGVAPAAPPIITTHSSRVEAPNLAFAHAGGRFGFTGAPRPDPKPLHLNLDLTPALLGREEPMPALYLKLRHPEGPEALRGATVLDPVTGSRQPLRLGPADPTGTRWGEAPRPPAEAPGPVLNGLPVSIALTPGLPVRLPFTVETGPGTADAPRAVRLVAFSTRAATLAEQEIVLQAAPDGGHYLELFPRPGARGSALVLIHATDGWTRSTTPLRVNLEDETNTAPVLSLGEVRRDGDLHIVPLALADAETAPDRLTVFFDTPQADRILDFVITGEGASRELRLRLQPDAKVDLSISAFDGELIGEASVRIQPATALVAASALTSAGAPPPAAFRPSGQDPGPATDVPDGRALRDAR